MKIEELEKKLKQLERRIETLEIECKRGGPWRIVGRNMQGRPLVVSSHPPD